MNNSETVKRIRDKARERLVYDLVYEIQGVRGRSIRVYPYKCIINTSVTAGSLLTNNATDGEKTIYYKDVVGIQYKRSGVTIGYLQFETSSGTMNHDKSNYFSENTFTFESDKDEIMEEVYEYIIGIFDELKSASTEITVNTSDGIRTEKLNALLEFYYRELVKNNPEYHNMQKMLKEDVENPLQVRIQINPIFIEGRYNKLVRNIPQTKWPCRKCKGRGCEACNFTGKQYPESVEELLSETALKYSKGYEAKFHGAGREDIDVRMLGDGRPFVLEIKEPRIRKLDLEKIEREANEAALGKTAYHNLKYTVRKRKAEIKTSSPDTYKVYRALVECEDEIREEDLNKLQSLHTIQQRTPIRVSHRRADKIREKEVKELSCKYINPHSFEMIIKTEGGLYIKELISSDEGRSKPSVSEVLGTQAICAELDVIEVGIK